VFIVAKADICCESELEWMLELVAIQTLCSRDTFGRIYKSLASTWGFSDDRDFGKL
jgi:hypothetical protein